MTTIHVGPATGPGAYDVHIGHGVIDEITTAVPQAASQVLLAHAAAVPDTVAQVEKALQASGLTVHRYQLPDAEAAKTVEVIANGWALMGQAAFTRTDLVVAVGGGAVTDAAGFLAASWLRGVPVIQVPTTLLAMVDAAVGGKTGINTAEGKNLVGAFHPPLAVFADLDTLSTLPARDLTAGLAEVIKCGFIADEQILTIVETNPDAALDPTSEHLAELVERAIAVKADVVTKDLKEAALREILNYGHTFAHAIEQVEQYTWRHGDAVSVGMVYVAELAHAHGMIDTQLLARHREVLAAVGLPTRYDAAPWRALRQAMGRDKKARGSNLRFVVLDGRPGAVTRLESPDEQSLVEAYDAVR